MAHMRAASARAQNLPAESYAPIARSLAVLDGREKERMTRICYVLAREGIAFLKYLPFHALAEIQGWSLDRRTSGLIAPRPSPTL